MSAVATRARAQAPNRMYRLGHLANAADSEAFTRQITLPELARLGFVEGRNLVFDARVGPPDALPRLMEELLAAKPDAIVAVGPAIAVAGKATRSVPTGLAGNEAALQKAAERLGVKLLVFTVATSGEYPAAFAAMQAQGAQALLIGATPQFQADGKQLAGLALQGRLPTVCEWPDMARAGCLIGYGPSRTALRKRMAAQIAQIFRGVAPGSIPIERPTALELALNLGIAKSLGLKFPDALLATAGELVE